MEILQIRMFKQQRGGLEGSGSELSRQPCAIESITSTANNININNENKRMLKTTAKDLGDGSVGKVTYCPE